MQCEIKIPYALQNGQWVHISQVANGLKANCVCPCCEGTLLAKKGEKVTHHFAHFDKTSCQPETVLHFIAKTFLYQRIQQHLGNQTPLNISWPCARCEEKHEANLLRKTKQVRLEHDLGVCKPDIVLLAGADVPVAVIEIIVTHKPEEAALSYYRQQRIAVIEFEVQNGNNLEPIRTSEGLNATRVDQCTNPKCKQCGESLRGNRLVIFSEPCRRCKHRMKVCFLLAGGSCFRGPKEFTEWEVEAARQNGVLLERKFSKTLGGEYLANTCPTCKQWIGEHYLMGNVPAEKSETDEYVVGHHCFDCSRDWPCQPVQVRHGSKNIEEPETKQDSSHNQPEFF